MRDLLIAGAMKAGTTSLYRYLAEHPAIAPSVVKETHYYADDLRNHFAPVKVTEEQVAAEREANPEAWFHHARIRSRVVYDSLFPVDGLRQVRVEASPSYLPSKVAAGRIADEAADPLVVVVLRNPYERIISHYEMNKGLGITNDSLETNLEEEVGQGLPLVRNEHVALVRLSLYADDLSRLIGAVGLDRVIIVRTEQLKEDSEHVLEAIGPRLGLEMGGEVQSEAKSYNQTLQPRAPWMDRLLKQTGTSGLLKRVVPPSVKHRLKGVYYRQRAREPSQYEGALRIVQPVINEDLERLSDLLESDFSEWRMR